MGMQQMNRFGDERNCTVTWPKRLDLHQLRRVFGFAGQKFMLTEPIKCLAIFIFFSKYLLDIYLEFCLENSNRLMAHTSDSSAFKLA